jgi:hypothetical protein
MNNEFQHQQKPIVRRKFKEQEKKIAKLQRQINLNSALCVVQTKGLIILSKAISSGMTDEIERELMGVYARITELQTSIHKAL